MPEPTFNEALLDSIIRHQIGIQRFASGLRNSIWELLDATEADLKRQIRRAQGIGLDSSRRVSSLNKLLRGLKRTRVGAWKNVRAKWLQDINGLAISEASFLDGILVAAVPGVELGTVLPDPERLANIVKSRPFEGKTLASWADDIEAKDIARIEDRIKIGLTQGETPAQISRRIVGTVSRRGRGGATEVTRQHAETITRTVTNGVAAEARRSYAEANSDLAKEELFTATLDSRTTPICQRFDGQKFTVGEGPRLPLHFNERSIYSPILDGQVIGERPVRNFTQQQLLRDFAEQNGIKAPRTRSGLPSGTKGKYDQFKRRAMRERTGQVPANTTYTDFLKRQSAAIQDDILGKTKGRLFRRGGLQLDKFVELDGSSITLATLASRHSDAFLRAGLDPKLFI